MCEHLDMTSLISCKVWSANKIDLCLEMIPYLMVYYNIISYLDLHDFWTCTNAQTRCSQSNGRFGDLK